MEAAEEEAREEAEEERTRRKVGPIPWPRPRYQENQQNAPSSEVPFLSIIPVHEF
jgi:hypothetical protein